ncbi:MAG: PolC-type DNA polymerase III, partial [Ruminococcus sp.]|nr:PolC-type DNA polymerase III [Ruminococcus sp.]
MMEITISDFLNEYCTDIPESIKNGRIFRITYSDDMKYIKFFALFENIVPSKDIFLFESSVSKTIGTENIKLNPRYDKSLFSLMCIPELIELLKRDISVVNGFLNDADIRLDGNNLNIRLMHGGYDMLKHCNFNSAFSQLIYNQFGIKINIGLEGEKKVNTKEYNEMVSRF